MEEEWSLVAPKSTPQAKEPPARTTGVASSICHYRACEAQRLSSWKMLPYYMLAATRALAYVQTT